MKSNRGSVNVYYSVREAHAHCVIPATWRSGKGNTRRQEKDRWWPGICGEGGRDEQAGHRALSGQWNYSVWHCGGSTSSRIHQNPRDVPHRVGPWCQLRAGVDNGSAPAHGLQRGCNSNAGAGRRERPRELARRESVRGHALDFLLNFAVNWNCSKNKVYNFFKKG